MGKKTSDDLKAILHTRLRYAHGVSGALDRRKNRKGVAKYSATPFK
jgi:hypothetical protein